MVLKRFAFKINWEKVMVMMKQDRNLDQKTNKSSKNPWLDGALLAILALIIILSITITNLHSAEQAKMIGILIMVLALILVPLSYFRVKSFYHGDSKDLFVPKSMGVGITINPNNPLGKVIWVVIVLVLLYFLFKIMLTPV
ncbi:XRE family transcriptional regulator [Lentilactobacillus hilgardii]|nr:XRE family transcriptional regulator [Lentilactobacillus hilgardii]MCP9348954.1 XRE family transcriptional regulator [Lentilactobacillus hilgardii]MCP9351820.1 XRE family transcriptional regulator [Lentilactobacillus hilgardii]